MAAVADTIERSDAVVITGDCFPVDDAGARAQAGQRLDNQRETIGEIIARATVEPDVRAVLAGDNAKAIVLNLMQPFAARGQLIGFTWEARRDEAGWEGTLQHGADS
jgi:hypothetical protein